MALTDLVLATAPTADLVTLAQAKAQLNVEPLNTADDALIQAMIAAAMAHLDGPAGVLGRALGSQAWTLYLDGFPSGVIRLPLPPLISVGAVAYIDAAGVTQTLASAKYQVLAGERAELRPAYGLSWPSARCTPRAVTITFTCGFADVAALKLDPIRAAIKLMVGDLYGNRESVSVGAVAAEIPMSLTVQRLLAPLKIPRVG